MLYPVENEVREVKLLDGIWNFKLDDGEKGFEEKWYENRLTDTIVMPVPASYNDITTKAKIRDHIGWVWYDTTFRLSDTWRQQRVVLRFGSVTHHAIVYVNGVEVARHKGGFLPFEADVSSQLTFGHQNRITVAVNNVLDFTCLPCGEIITQSDPLFPEDYKTQETYFDFYNYAGIHRSVKLYTTPVEYIKDITVKTDLDGTTGLVSYEIELQKSLADCSAKDINKSEIADENTVSKETSVSDSTTVVLYDETGQEVARAVGAKGTLLVTDARLWEPGNAYLYEFVVTAGQDQYELPVGIRTVTVTKDKFLINGKEFYFKGFGKHEDSDIRGKGYDAALNVRDFELLRWIGANSFRTSHYPYSDELMQLADREGMVIIDEVPAVGMCFFSDKKVFIPERVNDETLEHHLQTIDEVYARDKNHPCVVMWSVANEASTHEDAARPYFETVINRMKQLDDTRPVTIVMTSMPLQDQTGDLVDVICVNRYYAWYVEHARLEIIAKHLKQELDDWHNRYQRPIVFTEFGADTLPGYHKLPSVTFTEEFQVEYMKKHFEVFDKLDYLCGEQVWAFADFATKQGLTRVDGNKKGIFTRQRQPKAAAFVLKERWEHLNK